MNLCPICGKPFLVLPVNWDELKSFCQCDGKEVRYGKKSRLIDQYYKMRDRGFADKRIGA